MVFYTVQYLAADPATRESTRFQAYAALDEVDRRGSLRVGGYNVLLAGPTLGGTARIKVYNSTGQCPTFSPCKSSRGDFVRRSVV